jgi:4-hydroxy-tetrahydrodipicolinate synthase
VTPLRKIFSVDTEALCRIVNFSVDGGIEYLVILGTTAENATLSQEERIGNQYGCVECNNGRLVLGVGGNNTMKVVEELETRDLSPFVAYCQFRLYNKPTQEGIYQHFKELLKPPIPVIIYNVPGRTSSNMLPKTVLRLANDFKKYSCHQRSSRRYGASHANFEGQTKDFLVIS